MKKICKGCGKNRKIGKFGILSRSADGKNYYCRDCMKLVTKRYRSSFKGRKSVKKSNEKYKGNNKEKISEYNRKYYRDNIDRILYNKKCRETLTCEEETFEYPKKTNKIKINKSGVIEINPKRKYNG
jgi:hypothetical protein